MATTDVPDALRRYSPREAAVLYEQITGRPTTDRTIRAWCASGRLSHWRPTQRTILISETDVRAMIDRSRREAA